MNTKLKLREIVGLTDLKRSLKQAKVALLGEEDVPSSKLGLSSIKQLYPTISPKMWFGKAHIKRKVIISNLFNHTQTPVEEGWSVKKTQTLDFRGKKLTYNSHNGTDFAIPVGTKVCTAAAGKVVAIKSEFNRGGLKIFIDHGEGLMTCYAHLARSLVKKGQFVRRGESIALSAYSGIDGFFTFPFGIPHVHFNIWHNTRPIDPFPFHGNSSLWHGNRFPIPFEKKEFSQPTKFNANKYDEDLVNEAIRNCKTAEVAKTINSLSTLEDKAVELIIQMNYYPTRFKSHINIYGKEFSRKPSLDLPFLKDDFDEVVFLDEL